VQQQDERADGAQPRQDERPHAGQLVGPARPGRLAGGQAVAEEGQAPAHVERAADDVGAVRDLVGVQGVGQHEQRRPGGEPPPGGTGTAADHDEGAGDEHQQDEVGDRVDGDQEGVAQRGVEVGADGERGREGRRGQPGDDGVEPHARGQPSDPRAEQVEQRGAGQRVEGDEGEVEPGGSDDRPGRGVGQGVAQGTHGVGPDCRGEQQPADPVLPDEDRPQDQQSGQPDDEQPLAADRQGGQHPVVPERVGSQRQHVHRRQDGGGYADGPQRPVGRLPGPSTPHGARDDLAHGDSIGQPAGTLSPAVPRPDSSHPPESTDRRGIGPLAGRAAGQRLCNASSATAMDAATRKSSRGSGTVTV